MTLIDEQLSKRIIGACVEVHRILGPGLLESTYEECVAHEFALQGIDFVRQVPLPVNYKGHRLNCGYRIDFVVEQAVVVELKTVDRLLPVHQAQVLTYLRLMALSKGLLVNFHNSILTAGVKSVVL